MFDPSIEPPISLSRALTLDMMPRGLSGKPPVASTIWRWAFAGVKNPHTGAIITLETIRCGRMICTSEAAVLRFFSRLSQPDAQPMPSDREMQRRQLRAKNVLEAAGIA